jgi:hypothetical protein
MPADHLQKLVILHQVSHLFGRLARYMRTCCLSIDQSSPLFGAYSKVFSALRESYELGIYNLNYDSAAIAAWPEAFNGFSADGDFDPSAVFARKDWGFIYHLHGSVHHTLVDSHGTTIRWERNLNADFHDGDEVPAAHDRTEFKTFPRTTLIAGGLKLDQLLVDPFQTFYASLNPSVAMTG